MKATAHWDLFAGNQLMAEIKGRVAKMQRAYPAFWHEESDAAIAAPDPLTVKELDSWTPIQLTDLSAESFSNVEINFNRELVREQLRRQLGAVVVDYEGLALVRLEMATLRQLLVAVDTKVDHLVSKADQSVCVPIRSFAPEPFDAVVPIDVVISPEDDGYAATFLDANLHAYGETKEEAFFNIRNTILETYQRLRELGNAALGKSMRRQMQVLSNYIKGKDESIPE
ncbi:MAG TPA: hypothetical protein VFO34_06750 [Candidatus Acidoferrales bacterium]|nr:hypothetical protein [Candidatus Acidoferrales bacterium]